MAEIIPFKGIRYNREKVGALSDVIAPPYDVISPAQQDAFYARSPYNVVRLDFGKPMDSDTGADNRYTRSKAALDDWLATGVLVPDAEPCLYFYRMDYSTPAGDARKLTGIICMLRLEEWDKGVVLPHERTLKGPKVDRMELIKATGVMASQIFSLYSDPAKTITSAMESATTGTMPDVEATDDDGTTHKVWAVKDAAAIKAAQDSLSNRPVFIADGHHRYETSLAYRDIRRAKGAYTGDEPFNFVPMFLANMEEDGLTVLPTHRLVSDLKGLDSKTVLDNAARYFEIEKLAFTTETELDTRKKLLTRLVEKGSAAHTFGYFFHGDPAYYLFSVKDMSAVKNVIGCGPTDAYCNLDVTVLHSLIIELVLGIDTEEIAKNQPVKFEKDGLRAVERVRSGDFTMCFLLNPTRVHQVKDVALAGEIMPQKSTYFYPKLLTGLVIAPVGG